MVNVVRKYRLVFIFLFFIFFIIYVGRSTLQGLDPDFGWHLRMGQLILSKGIPSVDPFSYTMPSYPFVDHEWLTNIGIALLYPRLGLVALSILFTLLAFSALFIQLPFAIKKWAVIPAFLSIGTLSAYLGIRPQILSWLFFSTVLFILLRKPLWKKLRFFFPFIFILWANLHGGFPIGIGALLVFLIVNLYQEKKGNYIDIPIFLCSVAVTFLNPYGYRLWGEVWVSLSDASLRFSIQEWLPTFFVMNYYFLLLFPITITFIFFTRKHFSLFEICLFILLLCFGLSSVRNVPFWIILAFPMTVKAFLYFREDIKTIPFALKKFNIAYIFYFFFCIIVLTPQFISMVSLLPQNFTQTFYPDSAIVYLKKHASHENIFSTYNWGGYLIWKFPQKKVFVDGRMPSWRRSIAPVHESTYAFDEYKHILSGKEPFSGAAAKYHIDTVLLNRSFDSKSTIPPLEIMLSGALHLEEAKPDVFVAELKKMGFKEVYKDNVAVIFQKK